MQPEANYASTMKKKAMKQATKAKGKAAGKKPEVTEANNGGDEMEVNEEALKVKKKGAKRR